MKATKRVLVFALRCNKGIPQCPGSPVAYNRYASTWGLSSPSPVLPFLPKSLSRTPSCVSRAVSPTKMASPVSLRMKLSLNNPDNKLVTTLNRSGRISSAPTKPRMTSNSERVAVFSGALLIVKCFDYGNLFYPAGSARDLLRPPLFLQIAPRGPRTRPRMRRPIHSDRGRDWHRRLRLRVLDR